MIRNLLQSCLAPSMRSTVRCYVTAVDKSNLSKLRKKTGIGFMNCKKALERFENDIVQAEKWLLEQAQKEGWAKASKLQGRPMSQGLVGMIRDDQRATLVEVNCETDFVAKNQKFHDLVSQVTAGCHNYFMAAPSSTLVNKTPFLTLGSLYTSLSLRTLSTTPVCPEKFKPSFDKRGAKDGGSRTSGVGKSDKPAREKLTVGKYSWIFFDLETTGLGLSDMTQLSAKIGDETFSRFVIPTKRICEKASEMTGLSFVGGVLYKNKEPVPAVSANDCISDFVDWLHNFPSPVLVAHNAKFDAMILCNCLMEIGDEKMAEILEGFVDTLEIFRKTIASRKSYKLESLVQDLLKDNYDAHDASHDVAVLEKLVTLQNVPDHTMQSCSFTFPYVMNCVSHKRQEKLGKKSVVMS